MTQCATCGQANALLFTCSHCDAAFCADHQFPNHACDRFTGGGSADRTDDWVWGGAPAAGADAAPVDAGGPAAAVKTVIDPDGSRGGAGDGGRSGETTRSDDGAAATRQTAAASHATSTEIAPIARDAARERRPDRDGPEPPPEGRGWPSDRLDDRSVQEWMREQSYPGFVAKVTSLSLLFTMAYYAGFMAVI